MPIGVWSTSSTRSIDLVAVQRAAADPRRVLAGGVGIAAGLGRALLHHRLHVVQQHVARQRRLARAGDAGDRHQALQRHVDVDVVAGCAGRRRAAQEPTGVGALALPARARPLAAACAVSLARAHRDAAAADASSRAAGSGRSRDSADGRHVGRRALRHHAAAALAGAGTDVDDVVGAADRVLVVLHHHQRVALARRACAARSAGSGCRARAGRWWARPARSTRPAGWSRAAPPAGCAAPRRPTASARRGPA